jgi:deoxyribodipyrimidine photo-lyase
MSTALVWFRRDLRLADNPALHHALERHERVVCVYVHDPDAEAPWAPGAASRWWLHHSLAALDASLDALGATLLIRQGPALTRLRSLVKECGAEAVYWNRLYEPGFVERDRHVKEALRADGKTAESFNGALLVEPHSIRTGAGEPYRVFTPYWRNAQARLQQELESGRAPRPAPTKIPSIERMPASTPLADLGLLPRVAWDRGFHDSWAPGEEGAHARLERFAGPAIATYRQARDRPSVDGTSGLSAALHFGEVSPLQLVARMQRVTAQGAGLQANAEWFVRELGWREFAHHLLFHFPRTPEAPLHERFDAMPWRPLREHASDLIAWQRGRTGVPIVDAGMRQLWRSGWMHNRVRMIVASFLTKNLLIPWVEGARWFWDTLVDANLANNTLGWQWTAGCGADASPYYRIFNPVLQSAKFDAAGDYIRRWVPELARLPDDAIHAPWQARAGVLSKARVQLGRDYPQPIVDLAASRARALAAYDQVKGG